MRNKKIEEEFNLEEEIRKHEDRIKAFEELEDIYQEEEVLCRILK